VPSFSLADDSLLSDWQYLWPPLWSNAPLGIRANLIELGEGISTTGRASEALKLLLANCMYSLLVCLEVSYPSDQEDVSLTVTPLDRFAQLKSTVPPFTCSWKSMELDLCA